jgi:MSHA biogenesis protein MshO
MMEMASGLRQHGFTLFETVIAIVIIGIVSAVTSVFIRGPVQSYMDSTGRAELTDEADLALRRMARDLRLALPNSIRMIGTDGHAVEFLLTKAGGRYLSAEDAESSGSSQPILDFESTTASNVFTVVGGMPSLTQHIKDDTFNYVVVYNLGIAPADAYQTGTSTNNTALINTYSTDASGNVATITLASNPFAQQSPPLPSPSHRFQVISGGVTYWCGMRNGSLTLMRYWNYGIRASAADPPTTGSSAILATNVASCTGLFNYNTLRNQHSGLLILRLALNSHNQRDPAITLVDQVHVDNTP